MTAPRSREWAAVLEILHYRAAWDILPRLVDSIEHEGLRRFVSQVLIDEMKITYESSLEMLGSVGLVRLMLTALSEDRSGTIADDKLRELKFDVIAFARGARGKALARGVFQ